MSYAKDVRGFSMYPTYRASLALLSDDERGKLLMSLFDYDDGQDTSGNLPPRHRWRSPLSRHAWSRTNRSIATAVKSIGRTPQNAGRCAGSVSVRRRARRPVRHTGPQHRASRHRLLRGLRTPGACDRCPGDDRRDARPLPSPEPYDRRCTEHLALRLGAGCARRHATGHRVPQGRDVQSALHALPRDL